MLFSKTVKRVGAPQQWSKFLELFGAVKMLDGCMEPQLFPSTPHSNDEPRPGQVTRDLCGVSPRDAAGEETVAQRKEKKVETLQGKESSSGCPGHVTLHCSYAGHWPRTSFLLFYYSLAKCPSCKGKFTHVFLLAKTGTAAREIYLLNSTVSN